MAILSGFHIRGGVNVLAYKEMTPSSLTSWEMTPSFHMSLIRHGGGRVNARILNMVYYCSMES